MYFDCVDNVTGVTYVKKDEDIEYNINFTQKLKVNTQADEAFNIYFGRNIDDLTSAVQNVLDIESQMSKVESMMKEERYSSDADQKSLSDILEGLTKQQELAKSQMTKAFESGIGQMQGYQEQISNAKADVGNRITRLDLTKSRLTEQKTNFTSLKSENEDIDHYGMKDIKDRIIEALAVRNITSNTDAPILCLAGPPGTGKTSIARSVPGNAITQYVML